MNIHEIEIAIKKEIKYIELKYHNLILFSLSVIIAILMIQHFSLIESMISGLGEYGLLGIFLAGAGYTTSVTTPIASVVIYTLGEFYNPLLIASLGALGSVMMDAVIYFVMKKFFDYEKKHSKIKIKLPQNKLLKKLYPLIGIFIIASPLPDELGIAFLSVYEKSYKHFLMISYFGNFIGILVLSLFGAM